jgi:hypothetical protein
VALRWRPESAAQTGMRAVTGHSRTQSA